MMKIQKPVQQLIAIWWGICLWCIILPLSAQEQGKHKKLTFQDSTGRIYWNLDLPVYVNISASPTAQGYRMSETRTENMQKYSNPMKWDGHGIHYIRHLDYMHHIQEEEVAFAVHVDGIAPKTNVELQSQKAFTKNNKDYYGQGLMIEASATDEMSGVAQIYYSINGSPYTEYTELLRFEEAGDYDVYFYAVDKTGNVEQPQSYSFAVDYTAPQTSIIVNGTDRLEDILSGRVSLLLETKDSHAGVKNVKYKFNDGEEKRYTSPITLRWLEEGSYIMKYFAEDNLMNIENENTYEFFLDKTPPTVMVEVEGDQHQNRGRIFISQRTKVKLTAEDNRAGVQKIMYAIDGKKEEEYTKPFRLDKRQGIHVISYRAIDRVQNTSRTQVNDRYGTVFLDLSSPQVSHTFQGSQFYTRDTLFVQSTTLVNLKAKDTESGIEKIGYSMNGELEQDYSEPFHFPSDGIYTVNYFARDNVGNENEADFTVVVDNQAPVIHTHWSIKPIGSKTLEDGRVVPIYSAHAKLYLAATDELIGTDKMYYSIDGGKEWLFSEPLKSFKKGLHSINIRATDILGNERVTETMDIWIE